MPSAGSCEVGEYLGEVRVTVVPESSGLPKKVYSSPILRVRAR